MSAILDREKEIALSLETSSMPADIARNILGLPDNVSNLTIVDLAAGASSLTANLLEENAIAFAVDRLYFLDGGEIDKAINRSRNIVLRRITNPLLNRQLECQIDQSISRFWTSYAKNRDRYIAGWLGNIPLEDNFSDWTVSLNGLSDMGRDLEVMMADLLEAIRITKPGGRVVMVPFHRTGTVVSEYEIVHQEAVNRIEGKKLCSFSIDLRNDEARMTFTKNG